MESLEISNMLSVKQNETAQGVKKLLYDMGKLKHSLAEKSRTLAKMHVSFMNETDDNILIFDENLDKEAMRIIANGGMKKTKKIVCVFSGNDSEGYSYILGSENINLKDLAKEFNSKLNGKGGGSESMIQGNLSATKEEIEKYLG